MWLGESMQPKSRGAPPIGDPNEGAHAGRALRRSTTSVRAPLASRASRKTPADIRAAYGNASFTGNNRVVFNIKGNAYRLVVAVRHDKGLMYVRFIGTHRQYDKIDVETI